MTMHLGHIALRVTSLDEARTYAREILQLRERVATPDASFHTSNEKHHELQLISGHEPGLDHIGLEVETEADMRRYLKSATSAGAKLLSDHPQEDGLANAFRIVAPGGLMFEVYCGMARDRHTLANGLRGPLRRFGHVTLLSTESEALVKFLVSGLGFRVSDTLGDRLTWLRCDTEHHGIAVASGEKDWLHHYAFELTGWAGMRDFLDGLIETDVRPVWGPVRHGPGLNIATYIPDTEGCLVEAFTEMQHIDVDATYVAVDWTTVEGARNLWGPQAPSTFLEAHGVPVIPPASTAAIH
jgi:catechol 2,3-dioxygenase-like lactoylglutathione lyase family enzyme